MDSILADQLEWLISGNMEGLRFKRQLILLSGCLADGVLPAEIEPEIARLSRRIACEEVFQALLEPLNAYLRQPKDKDSFNLDINSLVTQVEAGRQELNLCEAPNMVLILNWLLGRARDRKLLGKLRRVR